jgi:nucleotide-binding universal stress UspA family protein
MDTILFPQVKKILYTTDLSRNSAYAFGYAIDLAKRCGAKIVIIHAFEPLRPVVRYHSSLEDEQDYYATVRDEATQEIKDRVDRFCQKVDAYVGGTCSELISGVLVPIGHPVEEILELADNEDCDLIVLGTHGKGLLKQTFLGSVSKGVIERSRKPVLVVPLSGDVPDWYEM